MSRYFVDGAPVAVPEFDSATIADRPPNIIYIKSKMDLATDAKVKNELVTLGADNKTMEAHLGENQLALLIHNIVRWEGPDLGQIPCTVANIRMLDPTEPHIVLVLDEIARRNARSTSPNEKPPIANGLKSNGSHAASRASETAPLRLSERLILKQVSPSDSDGRPNRSDD